MQIHDRTEALRTAAAATVSESLQCHDAIVEHVRRCFRIPWKKVARHMDGSATSDNSGHKSGHSGKSSQLMKRLSISSKSDAMKHMLILRGLHGEAERVDAVMRAQHSGTLRDKIWLITDVPESSRAARWWHRFIIAIVSMSVVLFFVQTLPEFHAYTETSTACKLTVLKECRKQYDLFAAEATENPGEKNATERLKEVFPACAFQGVQAGNQSGVWGVDAARFANYSGCSDRKVEECGFPQRKPMLLRPELNGAPDGAPECLPGVFSCTCDADPELQPFHDHAKEHPLCRRPQCRLNSGYDLARTMEMGEIVFVTLFTIEFLLHLVSARSFKTFWRSSSNIIDLLAIAPFYAEVAYSLATIGSVQFDVGGGDVSFLKVLRLLAILRVFKMLRHIPETNVLWLSMKGSVTKLGMPMFFLAIIVVILAAILYEYEKGMPTLVPCSTQDMDPGYWRHEELGCEMREEHPNFGYRIALVVGTSKQETQFVDILRAMWVMLVTMTTVGYGGVSPITKVGKFVCVVASILGNFYLAMPITIIGSSFYKQYLIHLKQEAIIEKMRTELWGTQNAGGPEGSGSTSGHSLFDDHTIVLDRDPDRPQDLTKEELRLLQFYCRNKRRLIDSQKFFTDPHVCKRKRNELAKALRDIEHATDKCKMRHCEFGTVLNKLIHGPPLGKIEGDENRRSSSSELHRMQEIAQVRRQKSQLHRRAHAT